MSKANLSDSIAMATALAKLNPRFSSFEVHDPEYAAYQITVPRKVLCVQLDIPPGTDEFSLTQKVMGGPGTKLTITATEDASRYDPDHCLPDELKRADRKLIAVAGRPLAEQWSARTQGHASQVDKWTVNLPFAVEGELRDPRYHYRKGRPGWNGSIQKTATGDFLWLFYFAKEDPNKVRPHESLPQEVTVSHNHHESPYSQRNLAQARAQMYQGQAHARPVNQNQNQSQSASKKPRTSRFASGIGNLKTPPSYSKTNMNDGDDSMGVGPQVETVGSGDSGTAAYADAADGYTSEYV